MSILDQHLTLIFCVLGILLYVSVSRIVLSFKREVTDPFWDRLTDKAVSTIHGKVGKSRREYDQLSPLGKARVDIDLASKRKYGVIMMCLAFSGVLLFISPIFFLIPIVFAIRATVGYVREQNELIREANAKLDPTKRFP